MCVGAAALHILYLNLSHVEAARCGSLPLMVSAEMLKLFNFYHLYSMFGAHFVFNFVLY